MPFNRRIQWNAGTACVSECVLKTLACRGLRVGPSKRRARNSVTAASGFCRQRHWILELQSGPPATGLRKPESPKSAGESVGKSAGKKGIVGGTAGSSAGRPLSLEKPEKRHCSQQSPQQSPLSRHSSQHSPRHFWGIRAFSVLPKNLLRLFLRTNLKG